MIKKVYQFTVNPGVIANKTHAAHLQPAALVYVFQEAQAVGGHDILFPLRRTCS